MNEKLWFKEDENIKNNDDFEDQILHNQHDLPPEFLQMIDERIFELLA